MVLYIVGAGLSAKYLTLRAVEVLRTADKVYIDTYTSIAPGVDARLVRSINPRAVVVEAQRRMLEDEAWRIVEEARGSHVVVLVPGDPFIATTHAALRVEAAARGVEVVVVPGVSGVQAVIGVTGLQAYRFGRMVTLVYPEDFRPFSVLEVIKANYERGLHTLVLLDLRLEEGRAMTVPEAAAILLSLEKEYAVEAGWRPFLAAALGVGVARAGLPEEKCLAAPLARLAESGEWPPPPHTLVVTAPRLHPLEEDALKLFCGLHP